MYVKIRSRAFYCLPYIPRMNVLLGPEDLTSSILVDGIDDNHV
jgi:hypothetical protein